MTLERFFTRPVQYVLDGVVFVAALTLAYELRFDFNVPAKEIVAGFYQFPLVLLAQFGSLHLLGAYAFVWRYVGLAEAQVFVRAAIYSMAVLLGLRLGLPVSLQVFRVPISVIVINAILAFGGALGMRVARRMVFEYGARRRRRTGDRPAVLLIGAGREGVVAVREMQKRGEVEVEVKGFVDDDPLKRGAVISGVKVLGTSEELPALVERLGIDHVVITIGDAPRESLARLAEICRRIPVRVRTIPSLYEILQGRVSISRFRDVQVEDLLGRPPIQLDERELRDFLSAKTVMVTGAGGSIGSEIARQVLRFEPTRLLLAERAEFALFEIDREVRGARGACDIVPVVMDITDRPRVEGVFAAFAPQIVLHAAAHKHVPLMEDNAGEAIKNNILGTRTVAEVAGRSKAQAFVMISSDKAVRPASVMGATKRVAELVIQDLARRHPTRYTAVRFGNVLGSVGSVVQIFREQIARGGPVTVTHPEMTRYFMTIPEAVQLVLQAGAMGGPGDIFVLDMGEPVRILDLAKGLIELSGYKPFEEIDIVFTGVRPGEKLAEELQLESEQIARTRHPKIFKGNLNGCSSEELARALERLEALAATGALDEIRSFFNAFLPEARLGGDNHTPEPDRTRPRAGARA